MELSLHYFMKLDQVLVLCGVEWDVEE